MNLIYLFQKCRYPRIPEYLYSFGHMVLSKYCDRQKFTHDVTLVDGLEVYYFMKSHIVI